MIRKLAAAAALLAAFPAAAQQLSPADKAAIALAEARGKLLYAYDQAAWHGTDDMVAKLPDYQHRAGGWIVDGPADSPELVFFDRDEIDPHALYFARFRGNQLVSSHVLAPGEDASLSPARKRMIAARRAATARFVADKPLICTDQQVNTVVLPPASTDAPILVYILSPQTEAGVLPFGGNYRTEVAPDGTVGPLHPFTKSCVDLRTSDAAVKDGGKTAGLFVTHLIDPVPTEIHVFLSLEGKLPVAVGTSQGVWWVDGATITHAPAR